MNSGDPPEESQSPPDPVTAQKPPKKPQPPKRKRAYSRVLKAGARDQKVKKLSAVADETSDPTPQQVQSQAIRDTVVTKSAARKLSKADLERELKTLLAENALLKSQLDSANKSLAISEKKRGDAMASHLASQAKARESQKAAKNLESVVEKQAKQISCAKEETQAIVEEAVEQQKTKHQVSDV